MGMILRGGVWVFKSAIPGIGRFCAQHIGKTAAKRVVVGTAATAVAGATATGVHGYNVAFGENGLLGEKTDQNWSIGGWLKQHPFWGLVFGKSIADEVLDRQGQIFGMLNNGMSMLSKFGMLFIAAFAFRMLDPKDFNKMMTAIEPFAEKLGVPKDMMEALKAGDGAKAPGASNDHSAPAAQNHANTQPGGGQNNHTQAGGGNHAPTGPSSNAGPKPAAPPTIKPSMTP